MAMGQETVPDFTLPDTLTLKESIQIGLENNRTLKKAILDEEKAKYQRNEIRGAGLPQFSAYGQYSNFLDVFSETTLLYKEGLSPLTDLLDAETTQRQAKANYTNQIIQVRIAQLEIMNSTGKISNLLL